MIGILHHMTVPELLAVLAVSLAAVYFFIRPDIGDYSAIFRKDKSR